LQRLVLVLHLADKHTGGRMKSSIAAVFFCLACFSSQRAQSAEHLQVNVMAEHDGRTYRSLNISMSFIGEADGESQIQLPNEWGGQKEFYKSIRDLKIEGAEVTPTANAGPDTQVLQHAPNARIRLHYKIVSDADGPQSLPGQNNDHRTRLEADFVFALGNGIFIRPAHLSNPDLASVRISGFLPAHTFASDLEHARFQRKLTFGDLIESVLIGGDIRLIDAGDGGRLALRGKIDNRTDEEWKQAFTRIATAQRRYWRTKNEPFLVTVIIEPPKDPNSISMGGTGRSDAFAFFTTSNAEAARLSQVMAHEMMHTWIPRRIGRLRNENVSEAQDYWLSEGFTDWAAWRVAVNSGQWSAQDFVNAFNEQIKDYDLSPVREAPNHKIIADFWNDAPTGKLPYQRGMLLATYWNHKIIAASKGRKNFDHVLRQMQSHARKNPNANAVELLGTALKQLIGNDSLRDLDNFVDQGLAVDFPSDAFAACGSLDWIRRKNFHRGFDIEATQANNRIITGVIVNGPAWKAGLRDGMKLIARSAGEIGDSTAEIAYDVEDNGKTTTLRWLPEGEGIEQFRALQLKQNMRTSEAKACIQLLGG
jgi:predicted metalloprotease with PDZ domain